MQDNESSQADEAGDTGAGRSLGQPMGEQGRDVELFSRFQALIKSSAPEAEAVLDQATVELALMREHRKIIGRASVIAENILVRLHALVVEGETADVITFLDRKGNEYHRVPFLGDRESVSDALLKCANAISKLVPLERQAHGLKNHDTATVLPRVTLSMPNIRVVSIDGSGQIIKSTDKALLEHKS